MGILNFHTLFIWLITLLFWLSMFWVFYIYSLSFLLFFQKLVIVSYIKYSNKLHCFYSIHTLLFSSIFKLYMPSTRFLIFTNPLCLHQFFWIILTLNLDLQQLYFYELLLLVLSHLHSIKKLSININYLGLSFTKTFCQTVYWASW